MVGKPTSKNIKEILLDAQQPVAFVRTDANKVIAYDDSSWKYGIRKGAYGGNRKVFLGWKYWGGGSVTLPYWQHPFGSRRIRVTFTWSSDVYGTNETLCAPYFTATKTYGCGIGSTSDGSIVGIVGTDGAALLNGAWQTKGYIGCYAEVID